jgi:CheY-like chemotaxis protein
MTTGVTKRTWGAFTDTGLEAYLENLGVTQVVVAGVATSLGVESSAGTFRSRLKSVWPYRGHARPLTDGRAAVLVTDVIMPNMSGIEVAEAIIDRYPRVAVVLLSGYTAETLDLERVTSRGAMFVSKPVTSSQLLGAVQQALSERRADARRGSRDR